jgi:hypothetical protein
MAGKSSDSIGSFHPRGGDVVTDRVVTLMDSTA